MKRSFSLSRWLHNDKWVMIISLVLAIVLWALVVYGPGNAQDQVITGVPVSITLNDYASQTLNLRIVDGANATATVKVHGLRSVVSRLSAADITVTADTGNVIKEGTYVLPLRVTSNGDYTIQSVVGPDGNSATVSVTCAAWREITVPLMTDVSRLSVPDEKKYRFGTPSFGGDAVTDGMVTVSGSRGDISRVASVVAVIEEDRTIDETAVFSATLEARDETGSVVQDVTFNGLEDRTVTVTVPVMVYQKVTLDASVLNAPAGMPHPETLVTVSPKTVELWGVPAALDDYVSDLQKQVQVDFDHLSNENLTRDILLESSDGIRPVNGNELVTLSVRLSGIQQKTYDVPLSVTNFSATNTPSGAIVRPTQNKVSVVVCGTAAALRNITASQIRLTADLTGVSATGQQTVSARASVAGNPDVWVYYGDDASGVDLLVSVE